MILTDTEILKNIDSGNISIIPYNRDRLGTNSYDLSMSNILGVYTGMTLDVKEDNNFQIFPIPEEGFLLQPGELYIGSTVEYTDSGNLCPQIEGKSSLARLGMSIHITAGFGDIGFKGHWTLEITVVKPLRIYSGMLVAQIFFFKPFGEVSIPYNKKSNAKYCNENTIPMPSAMWKNFIQK